MGVSPIFADWFPSENGNPPNFHQPRVNINPGLTLWGVHPWMTPWKPGWINWPIPVIVFMSFLSRFRGCRLTSPVSCSMLSPWLKLLLVYIHQYPHFWFCWLKSKPMLMKHDEIIICFGWWYNPIPNVSKCHVVNKRKKMRFNGLVFLRQNRNRKHHLYFPLWNLWGFPSEGVRFWTNPLVEIPPKTPDPPDPPDPTDPKQRTQPTSSVRATHEANVFSFYETWNGVMAVGQGEQKLGGMELTSPNEILGI